MPDNMWETDAVPMPDVPVVFLKTGVMCSEPYGFYESLADVYQADLHQPDAIRLELSRNDGISFTGGMNRLVRRVTEERLEQSLVHGRNVVYDGFVNTFEGREDLRELIAGYGSMTVVIAMHTPAQQILGEIAERHANDRLTVPSRLTTLEKSIRIAKTMMDQVQFPVRGEEPAVHLDGSQSAEVLLSGVRNYVRSQQIAENT